MWCSSFFWWPARVTPRAGRSLGRGTEGKKNQGPGLQDPGPHPWPWAKAPLPDPSGLLQAELSHVTEGAEARLGEVVPVALQANGREPGLRGVQRRKVQGHRIQQGLGGSGREGQAGQSPLRPCPLSSVSFMGLHQPSLALPGSNTRAPDLSPGLPPACRASGLRIILSNAATSWSK